MSKQYKIGCLLMAFFVGVLFTSVSVKGAEDATSTTGNGSIKYISSDWSTKPIDPEDPDNEVEPGGEIVKTEGPLRLDLIPKINFGAQVVSNKDQLYYANAQLFKGETPARANYIQVTDTRGNLAGWNLSVRQETQFRNDTAKKKELYGAVLSFDKQWANSSFEQKYKPTIVKDTIKIDQIGTTYPIAIAEKGYGAGTWTVAFGSSGAIEGIENTLQPMLNADGRPLTDSSVENKPMYKNQAISLFVPGKTAKDPVKYSTVLIWTIAEL